MTRLIDADALEERKVPLYGPEVIIGNNIDTYNAYQLGWNDAIDAIMDNEPTIEAEPVIHGKWIPCAKSGLVLTELMRKEGLKWYGYKCSVCNYIRKGNALTEAIYCEHCGAKMDGEGE